MLQFKTSKLNEFTIIFVEEVLRASSVSMCV